MVRGDRAGIFATTLSGQKEGRPMPPILFRDAKGRRFFCVIQVSRGRRAKLSPCGRPSGPKRRSANTIDAASTSTTVLQRVP